MTPEDQLEAIRQHERQVRDAALAYLGLLGELYVVELHRVITESTGLDTSVPRLSRLLRQMQAQGELDSTLRPSPSHNMTRRYYRLRRPA